MYSGTETESRKVKVLLLKELLQRREYLVDDAELARVLLTSWSAECAMPAH